MKRLIRQPAWWLPALWLIVATMAARLEMSTTLDGAQASETAGLLLSDTRSALGHELYRSSDVYFHRGVRPVSKAPFRHSALTRLHEAISPNRHNHLDDGEIAEIMPWLLATIRMDPYNIEAWRVAAYWLEHPAVNKSDAAESLLATAVRRHPADYRPLLDLARLRLRLGKIDRAVRDLDRALALWRPDPPRGDAEEALLEKGQLLMLRALGDELSGNHDMAARRYARVVELFPERETVAARRDAILSGRSPELPALHWLQSLVEHQDQHHDCDDHEPHHGQDHH